MRIDIEHDAHLVGHCEITLNGERIEKRCVEADEEGRFVVVWNVDGFQPLVEAATDQWFRTGVRPPSPEIPNVRLEGDVHIRILDESLLGLAPIRGQYPFVCRYHYDDSEILGGADGL